MILALTAALSMAALGMPAVSNAAQGTVASGDSILGDSPTAPTGYTFTGDFFLSQAPTANAWSPQTILPAFRDFAAGAVASGKFYFIGGTVNGSNPTSTTNVWTPSSNSWTTAAAMPTARWGAAAAVVNNKVYVLGGSTTGGFAPQVWAGVGNNEEFNPSTGAWTTLAPMPSPMVMHAAASVGTTVYTFGGATGAFAGTNTTLAYHTTSNTWSTLAPLPNPIFGAAAVAVGNLVYVMGGVRNGSYSSQGQVYNTTTNTWSLISGMNTGRAFLTAFTEQGLIYTVGGMFINSNPSVTICTNNEAYDPRTGVITSKAPTFPAFGAAGGTVGNLNLVVGGDAFATLDVNTNTLTLSSTDDNVAYQAAHIYYVYRKN